MQDNARVQRGNVSFSRLVIVMTGTYVPLIFRASSNFSNLRGYVRLLVGGSNFSNFFGQKICRYYQFLLDLRPIYPCIINLILITGIIINITLGLLILLHDWALKRYCLLSNAFKSKRWFELKNMMTWRPFFFFFVEARRVAKNGKKGM